MFKHAVHQNADRHAGHIGGGGIALLAAAAASRRAKPSLNGRWRRSTKPSEYSTNVVPGSNVALPSARRAGRGPHRGADRPSSSQVVVPLGATISIGGWPAEA